MRLGVLLLSLFLTVVYSAQQVPAKVENIPFLVTFGNHADKSFGDDDFTQTFFFTVPKTYSKPFYIRVFDPDVSGKHDELKGSANTTTKFSVYGGKGCVSNKDARSIDPKGNYKSGNLLATKSFGSNSSYDDKYYTFGPFNPADGELSTQYYGYVFKIIAEGISGDDGNLYQYFLSASPSQNIPLEGANAFTFEYSFRLHANTKQVAHIYPYVDDKVVSVKQSNFDWDADGKIKLYSISMIGKELEVSGDNSWSESVYLVHLSEKGTSLDIQFQKSTSKKIANNNVVFYITNQYDEALPFFTSPIGGVPKYKGNILVK